MVTKLAVIFKVLQDRYHFESCITNVQNKKTDHEGQQVFPVKIHINNDQGNVNKEFDQGCQHKRIHKFPGIVAGGIQQDIMYQ